MVAFAFVPQNFGRLQGPTNDTFSLMNAARVVVDNQRWWEHNQTLLADLLSKKLFKLLAFTGGGDIKTPVPLQLPIISIDSIFLENFTSRFLKHGALWVNQLKI